MTEIEMEFDFNVSLDLNASLEIPQTLDSDLFAPLVEEHRTLSITTLPNDMLETIASNLDFNSFMNFTSTCKTLHQLETNTMVMRKVCDVTDPNTSVERCVEIVKERKQREHRENQRKLQRKKEERIEKIQEFVLCGRRCSSNIFFETFSLFLIFVASIMGAQSLDRTNGIPLSVTSWVLLIPAVYYGVMPYVLFILGFCTRDGDLDLPDSNRDVKLYGGAYDYWNQMYMWSKRMGFRPLKYLFIIATYVLFVLWTLDKIEFGFVLIPATAYCMMYWCVFTIDCGVFHPHCIRISCPRCLVQTPLSVLAFIGLLFTTLRSFGIFSNYYTLAFLPFMVASIAYIVLQNMKCCGLYCGHCSDSCCTCC